MNSAGWTAGSGPILSQRADPPTTMLIWGTNTSSRPTMPIDEQRHRGHAQPAVVDPHHHDHRDACPSAAHWICGPTIANVSSRWRKAFIADDE